MTIEEIDKALHDRITYFLELDRTYLSEVINDIVLEISVNLQPAINTLNADITAVKFHLNDVELYLHAEVKPLTDALTTEMLASITTLVDTLGTPEALISFLLDVPEGEEEAMLTLMQLLVSRTLELGV